MAKPIGARPLRPRPVLNALCMIVLCMSVDALFIFCDSTLDMGNNRHLYALVKSDFLNGGRDFDTPFQLAGSLMVLEGLVGLISYFTRCGW
jgi:hypothetical protein